METFFKRDDTLPALKRLRQEHYWEQTGIDRGIDMNNQNLLSTWRNYPDFRLLWISSLSTYIGRWMETAVGAWLVLQLTDSAFLVGVLGACRFAPMLLGPFCGAISDRYHRRQILLAVQGMYGTASFFVVVLFLTAYLESWHLFAYVLIGGICHTLDFSTRYAAAADIVERRHLTAAISLLVLAMGSTSIFGPLLGGNLLEFIKPSGCFIMIFGFFAVSAGLLFVMKIREPGKSGIRNSMHKDLMDGLRYVKSDPVLFSLVCIAAMVNLFVFPFWFALLPVFARDILHTTAGGYGQLMASIGLGAALGSLLAGSLPESVNKGKLLIANTIAWPGFLIIFSISRLFPVSAALLVLAGASQGMAMALIQSMMLMRASEEMRGRVIGARAFAVATLPLGNLIAGAGADLLGASVMLIIISSAAIMMTVFLATRSPELLKGSETGN
ncbi:MAG TPA: MFS transporter [Deltaproteobacteria bacterium]|nr:MFS transporter [Deltaproteobacteria bacterium]